MRIFYKPICVRGTGVFQFLQPSLTYILLAYIRLWDRSVSTSRAVIDVYSVSLYTFVGQECFNFSSRHMRIFYKPICVRGTGVFQFLQPSLTYIL